MPKPVSIKTCFSSCDHVSHCLLHTYSLLPLFPLLFTHRHSLSPAELILGVPGFPLPLAWAILPSTRLSGHPEKLPTLLCPADILVTNSSPCGYLAQNPQSLPQNDIDHLAFLLPGQILPFFLCNGTNFFK